MTTNVIQALVYWQFNTAGDCVGGPRLNPLAHDLPEGWTEIGIFVDRITKMAVPLP